MVKKYRYLDYLFLLAILLFGMWNILTGIGTMKWDLTDIYLPWRYIITEALNNHHLPLWNPYMKSGFAQMGDPGTWYPVPWIIGYISRYNVTSIHFEFLLHLYIAGIGMYKYGESKNFGRISCLIIATAYMFSGFFIGNAQHLGFVISAAWLPYVLYYFEKLRTSVKTEYSIKLSFVLFLMLSGGYPGIFIPTAYLLFGYLLFYLFTTLKNKQFSEFKKFLIHLSLSVAVFLIFSAVVLFSSFDLAQHITRGHGLEYSSAGGILAGSLPFKALISFIYPFATGYNDMAFWGTDFSLINCYMSVILFVLLVFINTIRKIRIEIRLFTIIGFFFLLLSMAEIFPFRKWLMILPFMDIFRYSALFRLFFIFYFIVATGYALDLIFNDPEIRKKFYFFIIGVVILIVAVNLGLLFYIEKWKFKKIFTENWIYFLNVANIKERIFLQGFINIGLFILLAFFMVQKFLKQINFKYAFLIVLVLDMILSVQLNIYATVITNIPVKSVNKSFQSFPEDYPIPSLITPQNLINDEVLSSTIPYLWKNLAVYYKQPSSDGYSPYNFYSSDNSMLKQTNDLLKGKPFLFLASVVNRSNIVDNSSIDSQSFQKIIIKKFTDNDFEATVTINKPQVLIYLQNYYPYWEVYINQGKKEILKINDTFMGVKLDQGVNRVYFRFYPVKILWAAYFSIASWICFLLFILFLVYHSKKSKLSFYTFLMPIILLSLIPLMFRKHLSNREIYKNVNTIIDKENKLHKDSISIILNVDNVSALSENQANIRLLNIDVKSDVAKLEATLDNIKVKYLLFVHVNKIHYPIVNYIIEDYFPNTKKIENFGGSYYMLSNISKNTDKYVIESCNDFEKKEFPNWNLNKDLIDATVSYSGKHSFKSDSINVYSATFSRNISEFLHQPEKIVIISAFIKSAPGINPLIVFQIARDGKILLWQKEDVNIFYHPQTEWYKIFLIADVSLFKFEPGDLITTFIWNLNKQKFWIDDFTIKTY